MPEYNNNQNKEENQNPEDQANPVSPVDIRRYQDPEGVSVAELDLGLWYVENRLKIIQFSYFLVFLFSVFAWGYFFFHFAVYLAKGMPEARVYTSEIFNRTLPTHDYYTSRAIKDIQLYPVKTIPGTLNKRDIIGQISNPNQTHSARFSYYFLNNDDEVGRAKGFILPGETKHLLALGLDIPNSIGGLRLALEDIQWSRVNPHLYGEWDDFKTSHLNFSVTSKVFSPSQTSNLSEKLPINFLSFNIANDTSYNYWNVPLFISLYSYNDLISIASYNLNDFESNTNREISFTWPGALNQVTDVKIEPNIDITRTDIYKDFDAKPVIFR